MAPRVEALVYRFDRDLVTFSNTLCTIPEFVVITDAGQAIAYYADDDPPLPYETLQELLEEHAQGCKPADFLRTHLQPAEIPEILKANVRTINEGSDKVTVLTYSRADLKAIGGRAKAHWGDFAVQFTARLA